jgi:glycosyltransferase involved in cell wall biosynthesis
MKVLIPIPHYYPIIGGLETWTKNIAERLSNRADIYIVTGKVKNQPDKEVSAGVNIFRTSLFSISNLSYSSKLYILASLPFIFLKSISLIKKEKVDIIHCQGFLSSLLGFCLHILFRIPYIVTVQRLEGRSNLLKNFIYKKASLCIAASLAIKNNFSAVGVKNTEVIPNGIDLKRFEGLKLFRPKEFTVITVARLEEVKGIEHLIKAVDNFNLVIIGEGSKRKCLEALVEELHLENRVKFLGEIPNNDIPANLKKAHCFCLPSLSEGFGIVILEAMAAGLPVVATRVGGIIDIVKDGETGILVEPKNSEEIRGAVLKIKNSQELSERLVENAIRGLRKYDWGNIVNQIEGIYKKVIRS